MVVEPTEPSTRALWPFATALAEVELVPFWYVVEDFSSARRHREVPQGRMRVSEDTQGRSPRLCSPGLGVAGTAGKERNSMTVSCLYCG